MPGEIAEDGSISQAESPKLAAIDHATSPGLSAVFWAGYQVEERYPHPYWIAAYGSPPRGMLGLDATVDDPNLDFKFLNNTEDYLLIQTKTE